MRSYKMVIRRGSNPHMLIPDTPLIESQSQREAEDEASRYLEEHPGTLQPGLDGLVVGLA